MPLFGRGTGFGNRLFPWARCVLHARASGARMLAPLWWWPPRSGALFKGGIDRRAWARQIALVGILQPRPGEVGGLERARVLLRAPRVSEEAPAPAGGAGVLRVFQGDGGQFRDLRGHAAYLQAALTAAARPRWRAVADRGEVFPIGINVRRGKDFRDASTAEEFHRAGALRTPLTWFVETLGAVRRAMGADAPALVVSDGAAADLAPLLDVGGVTLLRPGCAVSDVLALSRTRVLLGSGGSSFSAWAAYLGGMPTVTHPGQSLAWFGLEEGAGVGTFDPAAPDAAFLARAAAVVRAPPGQGNPAGG